MDGQFSLFADPLEPETSKDLLVYRSSAGSGKTFALVKEYLKIVLRDPLAYKHILAITFTNKATDEMKQRIIDELTGLSQGKMTDLHREISKDFKHYKPPVPIQLRATKALRNILHDYSRFEVSTIDHFFSQLVRLLARELKLNFNYEIDVDVDQTIQEALDRLYQGLHQTPQWRQWLEEYAYSQLDDDKGWQLDQKIMHLGKELFKERFHQSFSQINKEEVNLETIKILIDQLKETQGAFSSTLKSFAGKALGLIEQHNLLVKDFKGGSRSVANTFNKIVLKGEMELTKTFVKVAQGEDDWFAQTSLKKEELKAVAKAGLDQIAKDLFQYHEKFYPNYVTATELLKNIYAYGLLEALYEKWQEYQKEENLILISQNSFLLKSVIEDKDAPFLYEKIGSRFHHLLIDEFQDTSVYQWENLKPLVTHTLDEEYQKVLLVGDIKQSIYRWRGGDKNLLLHKVQEDLKLYKSKWKEEGLNDNWRSLKNVVGFNNMFFQAAVEILKRTRELPASQQTLEQVYREVVQNAKGADGGFIEIQFFEMGETDETNWEFQALDRTRSIILGALENGAKYQDILVLVEKNEHANHISSHLTNHNIPVISDQALKLSQHPVVRLLVAVLYAIQDPSDDLAKAEVLYLYNTIKGQPVKDFHQLFYRPWLVNEGWEKKLKQASGLNFLSGKPLFELVEEIVILFDLPGSPFLQRFQDICLDHAAKGIYQVSAFLEWYESKKETLTLISPSNHDAVTVMTVHKAKGLEAPIVIVPFAAFTFRPKGIFWTNKLDGSSYSQFKLLPLQFTSNLLQSYFKNSYQQELLEELVERLNVAYVAFTRPREQLYLLAPRYKKVAPEDDIKDLSQLLWIVLEQKSRSHPELRQIEEGLYRWGERQPLKQRETTDKQNALNYTPRGSNAYQHNIAIRSEAGKFFLLFDNDKAAKIKDGIKLHAVLERLGSIDQLELVLQYLVNQGLIKPFDLKRLSQKVRELFEDPLFASWFTPDWEVYTEREILSEGMIYKPDRVIIKGQEAIVIDYKREQHQAKYEKQVSNYARVLNEIGYSMVKKYLVYVQEFSIVEVH